MRRKSPEPPLEPPTITARPRDHQDEEGEGVDEPQTEVPEWAPSYFVTTELPGNPSDRGVPTIDSDLDNDPHAAPMVYPAWRPGETFVVSGPCGPEAEGRPGRWFGRRSQAREWAREKFGVIIEEHWPTYHWSFRVPVPGGPHDPRKGGN